MAKKKTKPAPIWEFEWESGAEEPTKIVQVHDVLKDFLSKLPTNADESDEDSLVAAFALWERYPWFASLIGIFNPAHHDWPNFWSTYQTLQTCHRKAVAILMYHAEKRGIDSGPLFKAAQLCRDGVNKSRNLGGVVLLSARSIHSDGICFWPQSINQSRFTVNQLEDIKDAETVMNRLNARLQLSTKKDSPPNVPDPEVVTLNPPTPPYMDLIVDRNERTVRREGHDALPVDLSRRPALWEMFIAMFEAGERGLTKPEMQEKISGEWSSSSVNKNALNGELRAIAIVVPNREWRLIDDGG